ncbi:hypothetical protein DXG03_004791 [Asterophora parasitica]|uniref:Uncharacterized protein n=1 Tax=Asterophora parasitica TaxID=117018 RepID=A0A9P7G676_9AGAR|nr:hypothetical protein DXG03_004791 [Asterophora parasitica]
MENNKTAQRQEDKLALITPSASPPSSRLAFFPRPYRISDQASPTKRPRLSSTARQFQPHTASSPSSGTSDVIDFHRAREESRMRLLDVWSGLAERYSRPLDGDDIIDITTGEVIKDRGIVRGFQKGTVGAFADPKDNEDSTEDENDDEDEVDELDAFASPGPNEIGVEVETEGRRVPPVEAADPRDAEDLREFLEAERRRREVYGSEVDDTEASLDGNQTDDVYAEEPEYSAACLVRDATPEEDEKDDSSAQTMQERVEPFYVDSGSDDELDNWERDEASTVYRLPPKFEDSDSEIEFVDPPRKEPSLSPEIYNSSPPTELTINMRQRNPAVQHQLQTPPRSQTSSSIPPATPDKFFAEFPPSSDPPQSSSPLSSHHVAKPKSTPRNSNKARSEHKRTSPSSHATRAVSTPIPRLDLSKVARSGDRPTKPKPQHAGVAPLAPGESASGSASCSKPKKPSKQQMARGKTHVEVYITEQPPFQASKASDVTSEPREVSKKTSNATKAGPSAKEKGKEKATANEQTDSSDAPVTKPKYGQVPPTTPSTYTGQKRKRVVSGAEVDSYVKEVPPQSPKITQSRSRKTDTSRPRQQSMNRDVSVEHDDLKGIFLYALPVPRRYLRVHPFAEPEFRPKERRQPTPEWRARSLEDDGGASQEEDDGRPHQERHFSRAPSHLGDHPYYAYPQPPYPPHHSHKQQMHHHPHPHMYAPIPDPRAQFIITQAMHQLSALVTGAWPAPPPAPHQVHARGSTPFTPSSHHHHYPPNIPSSVYTTPTHHPHPYPYAYDPDLSRATQPPDSPEVRSSLSLMESASNSGGRRRSIVKRSQSRGRKVSFRLEEGADTTTDISTSPDVRVKADNAPAKTKGKEMAQPVARVSGSDSDGETEIETPSRGRSKRRGQTPGPAPHVEESHPAYKQQSAARRSRSGPGQSRKLHR